MRTELIQLVAALPVRVAHAGRLGLVLPSETPASLRLELFARLTHMCRTATGERHTLTAWLGDLLVSTGRLRRGQITAYAIAAGLDAGTLSNAKLVCSRIPVSCRHEGLSWSHHCEVAMVFSASAEIERWLARAEAEKLSTAELRRSIRWHLATSLRSATPPRADIFTLLRELRAASRTCERLKSVWQIWPPCSRRLALEELQPLAEFMDHLHRRAERPAVTPGLTPPPDVTVN